MDTKLNSAKLQCYIVCINYCVLNFLSRLESYSCKMAGNDKKLYKQLSHQDSNGSSNLQALSPPQTFVGSPLVTTGSPLSPTGVPAVLIRTVSGNSTHSQGDCCGPQFCDTISNKTLFYLQSTLTASYQPDYDFSNTKSEEFSRVPSLKWVMDAVKSNLSAAAGEQFTTLELELWAAVDKEIKLSECDIYRY